MTLPSLAELLTPWSLALLGLCVGSFLNVVIHRLPKMMERRWALDSAEVLEIPHDDASSEGSAEQQTLQCPHCRKGLATIPAPVNLSRPRSRCPACQHAIAWHENIPVLSYLWLRGRCSACKVRISVRYPLVELLTAALFAATGWHFSEAPVLALMWCGVVATLIALAGIDWDTTVLPDELTQPLLWAGLAAAALGWTKVPLATAVGGAIAGYLSLWVVYWTFKIVTGKEGMGYGDFKLLAALGAWLGWQMLLPIVLGASLIGAVVGIGMKYLSGLREGKYVPFGPFLAGGGIVVMLAGPQRVFDWFGWV